MQEAGIVKATLPIPLATLALALTISTAARVNSPRLRQCPAHIDMNAMENSQRVACATSDMDRADELLNATYKQAMAKLAPTGQRRLVLAERRWIDHRRATCAEAKFERKLNPPRQKFHAPGADYFRMPCLTDETDKRTAEPGTCASAFIKTNVCCRVVPVPVVLRRG